MFPSLLPHTTRSTIETAPKLDNFYNSVDSSAIPDMVVKYSTTKNTWHKNAIFSVLMWARNLILIRVSEACPWASFMFPSLLPQTTRSTIKTAPKLDNFYNSVDSSAIPDMVAKYFPSSQKTEEYLQTELPVYWSLTA